jgi:hypothetical protein
MFKSTKIKVEIPREFKITKENKDELAKELLIKKLKRYGYFDKDGKWKEK